MISCTWNPGHLVMFHRHGIYDAKTPSFVSFEEAIRTKKKYFGAGMHLKKEFLPASTYFYDIHQTNPFTHIFFSLEKMNCVK